MQATKTRKYDLHLVYEHGWDNSPRLFIYGLYFDGEYWANDNDYSYAYNFTPEDMEWIVAQFDLDGISDYWVDEWFSIEDTHLIEDNLPPRFKVVLDSLPEYEPVILDNSVE
jgi:hypothetical protein